MRYLILAALLLTGCSETVNNINDDVTGPDGTVITVSANGFVRAVPSRIRFQDASTCTATNTNGVPQEVQCSFVRFVWADVETGITVTGSLAVPTKPVGQATGDTAEFVGIPAGDYAITQTTTYLDVSSQANYAVTVPEL